MSEDASVFGVEGAIRAAMHENDKAKQRSAAVAEKVDRVGAGIASLFTQLTAAMNTLEKLRGDTDDTLRALSDMEMAGRPVPQLFLAALEEADNTTIHGISTSLANAGNREKDAHDELVVMGRSLDMVFSYLNSGALLFDNQVPGGGQIPTGAIEVGMFLEQSGRARSNANAIANDYMRHMTGNN